MSNAHRRLRAVTLAALAASPWAVWALGPAVESGLEVSGAVVGLSSQQLSVVTLPLPVSQIAIADAAPGVFDYQSSADIGLRELKVFGSLSNASGSVLGNGETAVFACAPKCATCSPSAPP